MKIAILGLGQSVDLYQHDEDFAIGVNDIWRKFPTEYVVCLDAPQRFEPDRLKNINESAPFAFYSQLTEWSHRPDFVPITLQPQYPDYICQIDLPSLPMSHCSPFVAAVVAYKFHRATEIHLYGVDLINHPHLAPSTVNRIRRHFANLKTALAMRRVGFIVHGSGVLRSL